MNRTDEYLKVIVKDKQEEPQQKNNLFYDTIFATIQQLDKKLHKNLSYSTILKYEDELSKVSENINQTFDCISVEGSKDEILHFEGIKMIIKQRLNELKIKLDRIKNSKIGIDIELEPEKPKVFKEVPNISVLEYENKEIVENGLLERYKLTRQRLLEIESIQDNITENLHIQDERIDDIILKTGDIHNTVASSKDLVEKGGISTSFFRRFFFILLLCLSFVILFLHLYHK